MLQISKDSLKIIAIKTQPYSAEHKKYIQVGAVLSVSSQNISPSVNESFSSSSAKAVKKDEKYGLSFKLSNET